MMPFSLSKWIVSCSVCQLDVSVKHFWAKSFGSEYCIMCGGCGRYVTKFIDPECNQASYAKLVGAWNSNQSVPLLNLVNRYAAS